MNNVYIIYANKMITSVNQLTQQILEEVADILKTPGNLDCLSLLERKEVAQTQLNAFNMKSDVRLLYLSSPLLF